MNFHRGCGTVNRELVRDIGGTVALTRSKEEALYSVHKFKKSIIYLAFAFLGFMIEKSMAVI